MIKINKDYLIHIVKLLIGGGLLIWIFHDLDFLALRNSFISADIGFLILTIVSAFALIAAQAMRQYSLLANIKIDVFNVIKIQYVATFVGNFLPATLGIDLYKSFILKKHTNSFLESYKVVLIDRVSGLFVITFFGVLSFFYMPILLKNKLPNVFQLFYSDFIVFLIISVFVVGFLACWWMCKKWSFLGEVSWKTFIFNVFLVYGAQVFKFYFLFKAIDSEVDLITIAQMLLVVQFASLIPLSIGGLGIVEGSIIGTLIVLGVSSGEAAFIAISNRITILLVSMLGYYFWIKQKKDLTV